MDITNHLIICAESGVCAMRTRLYSIELGEMGISSELSVPASDVVHEGSVSIIPDHRTCTPRAY
jgi:hypothetical protein